MDFLHRGIVKVTYFWTCSRITVDEWQTQSYGHLIFISSIDKESFYPSMYFELFKFLMDVIFEHFYSIKY